jgi:hypothetical protein
MRKILLFGFLIATLLGSPAAFGTIFCPSTPSPACPDGCLCNPPSYKCEPTTYLSEEIDSGITSCKKPNGQWLNCGLGQTVYYTKKYCWCPVCNVSCDPCEEVCNPSCHTVCDPTPGGFCHFNECADTPTANTLYEISGWVCKLPT